MGSSQSAVQRANLVVGEHLSYAMDNSYMRRSSSCIYNQSQSRHQQAGQAPLHQRSCSSNRLSPGIKIQELRDDSSVRVRHNQQVDEETMRASLLSYSMPFQSQQDSKNNRDQRNATSTKHDQNPAATSYFHQVLSKHFKRRKSTSDLILRRKNKNKKDDTNQIDNNDRGTMTTPTATTTTDNQISSRSLTRLVSYTKDASKRTPLAPMEWQELCPHDTICNTPHNGRAGTAHPAALSSFSSTANANVKLLRQERAMDRQHEHRHQHRHPQQEQPQQNHHNVSSAGGKVSPFKLVQSSKSSNSIITRASRKVMTTLNGCNLDDNDDDGVVVVDSIKKNNHTDSSQHNTLVHSCRNNSNGQQYYHHQQHHQQQQKQYYEYYNDTRGSTIKCESSNNNNGANGYNLSKAVSVSERSFLQTTGGPNEDRYLLKLHLTVGQARAHDRAADVSTNDSILLSSSSSGSSLDYIDVILGNNDNNNNNHNHNHNNHKHNNSDYISRQRRKTRDPVSSADTGDPNFKYNTTMDSSGGKDQDVTCAPTQQPRSFGFGLRPPSHSYIASNIKGSSGGASSTSSLVAPTQGAGITVSKVTTASNNLNDSHSQQTSINNNNNRSTTRDPCAAAKLPNKTTQNSLIKPSAPVRCTISSANTNQSPSSMARQSPTSCLVAPTIRMSSLAKVKSTSSINGTAMNGDGGAIVAQKNGPSDRLSFGSGNNGAYYYSGTHGNANSSNSSSTNGSSGNLASSSSTTLTYISRSLAPGRLGLAGSRQTTAIAAPVIDSRTKLLSYHKSANSIRAPNKGASQTLGTQPSNSTVRPPISSGLKTYNSNQSYHSSCDSSKPNNLPNPRTLPSPMGAQNVSLSPAAVDNHNHGMDGQSSNIVQKQQSHGSQQQQLHQQNHQQKQLSKMPTSSIRQPQPAPAKTTSYQISNLAGKTLISNIGRAQSLSTPSYSPACPSPISHGIKDNATNTGDMSTREIIPLDKKVIDEVKDEVSDIKRLILQLSTFSYNQASAPKESPSPGEESVTIRKLKEENKSLKDQVTSLTDRLRAIEMTDKNNDLDLSIGDDKIEDDIDGDAVAPPIESS